MKNNDAVVIGLHPNNDEIYRLIITLATRNRAQGDRIEEVINSMPEEEISYVEIADDNDDATYLKIFCADERVAKQFFKDALGESTKLSIIDNKELKSKQIEHKINTLVKYHSA